MPFISCQFKDAINVQSMGSESLITLGPALGIPEGYNFEIRPFRKSIQSDPINFLVYTAMSSVTKAALGWH